MSKVASLKKLLCTVNFRMNVVVFLFVAVGLCNGQKTVSLTTSNPSADGASVTISSSEVSTTNSDWDINSSEKDTWHLIVSLSSDWGFHSNHETTITFGFDFADPSST